MTRRFDAQDPSHEQFGAWLGALGREAERDSGPPAFPQVLDPALEALKGQQIATLSAAIGKHGVIGNGGVGGAGRRILDGLRGGQGVGTARFWVPVFGVAAAAALALVSPAGLFGTSDSSTVAGSVPHTSVAEGVSELDSEHERGVAFTQVVGKVVVTRGGNDVVAHVASTLGVGDELSTTGESFATVELGQGVRADLSSATTVQLESVDPLDQRVFLRTGRLDINVPKAREGKARRVQVITPDSSVVVRGTIFSVEVTPGDEASRTRVAVSRGAVAVLTDGREALVRAGQSWESGAANSDTPASSDIPAEGAASAEGAAAPAVPPKREKPAVRSGLSSSTTKPRAATVKLAKAAAGQGSGTLEAAEVGENASSTLSEENRIFAFGLKARDAGEVTQARFWFARLLQRFPASPLVGSARRELGALEAANRAP